MMYRLPQRNHDPQVENHRPNALVVLAELNYCHFPFVLVTNFVILDTLKKHCIPGTPFLTNLDGILVQFLRGTTLINHLTSSYSFACLFRNLKNTK